MTTTGMRGQGVTTQGLPEIWKAAFERDQSGDVLYADPAPERKAAHVLAAFIVTGLAFLALPGTLLGVGNLISIAERRSQRLNSLGVTDLPQSFRRYPAYRHVRLLEGCPEGLHRAPRGS